MRYALYATALYCVLFGLTLALVTTVHRHWWRQRWLRLICYGQFPLALVGNGLWLLSRSYELTWLMAMGWGLFAGLFLYQGSFLIALLLTAPAILGARLYDRSKSGTVQDPSSLERRRFLRRSLGLVPVLGAVGVSHGIYASSARFTASKRTRGATSSMNTLKGQHHGAKRAPKRSRRGPAPELWSATSASMGRPTATSR